MTKVQLLSLVSGFHGERTLDAYALEGLFDSYPVWMKVLSFDRHTYREMPGARFVNGAVYIFEDGTVARIVPTPDRRFAHYTDFRDWLGNWLDVYPNKRTALEAMIKSVCGETRIVHRNILKEMGEFICMRMDVDATAVVENPAEYWDEKSQFLVLNLK